VYDDVNSLGNSDHFPFLVKQIPALFFFSKGHPDLHTPADDVEKLNLEKMEKVTRLVFQTSWITANTDNRPFALPYK